MNAPRKTYDTKCWDIAEYFLADVRLGDLWPLSDDEKQRHAHELAYEVQQVVEDYIRDIEQRSEERMAGGE
jgi:hypothetical protein